MQPAQESTAPQAGSSLAIPAELQRNFATLRAAISVPDSLCQLYSAYLTAKAESAKREADVLGRLQVDIPWLLHAYGELDRAMNPSAEQRETIREGSKALMEWLKEGGFFAAGQKAWEQYARERDSFLGKLPQDQLQKLRDFCADLFRLLAPDQPGITTMVDPTELFDFLVEQQSRNESPRLEEFIGRFKDSGPGVCPPREINTSFL